MFWLIALGQALVFGFAARYLAQEKGKEPTAWFWYGFVFGLIGFLVIALTPASRSADESTGPGGGSPESPKLVFVETPPIALDLHSPVEVRDIGLAIDETTGRVYARPVFFNVSDQIVTAVKFTITGYDSFSDLVGSTVEAAVQDESAPPRSFLRSKLPVQLSPGSRKADLQITRVALSDGTMWDKGDYPLVIPAQQAIDQVEWGRLQRVAGSDAVGYGLVAETCWVCVCGRHNLVGTESCRRCSRAKADVLSKFNNRTYTDKVLLEQEEQAAAAAALRLEQAKLASARQTKMVWVGTGIAVAVISATVATSQLSAYLTFRNGKALLAKGQFDAAVAALARLGGRFHADQLIDDAKYQKGLSLLDAGQYDEALAVFKGVRSRVGLTDAVYEASYRQARSLLGAGDYVGAMRLFSTVAGYKDSQTQIDEIQYREASNLMKGARWEQALAILQKMPSFRDSAALAKECSYPLALSLHSVRPVVTPDGNIDGDAYWSQYKAYDLFRQLRGYKDVDAILRDGYYLHEIFEATWTAAGGAFSLEIGRLQYSTGYADVAVRWHGRDQMQTGAALPDYITTVRGNQLSDGWDRNARAITVELLDGDTIRLTVDGSAWTLTRQGK